jgi:hypothetical protein
MTRAALPRAALLFFVLAATGQPRIARAARPLVTDDAFLVERGACQLETWGQLGPAGDQFWALPACNLVADLEITAGFAILPPEPDAAPNEPAFVAQVKTVLLPMEERGYGFGLAFGTSVNGSVADAEELLGTVYGYIPASLLLADDRLEIDANLGFRYESEDAEVRATWGLAGQIDLFGPVSAVAELYGSSREHPFAQAGLRFSLVPDRLQLDTTYGLQIGGPSDEQYMTVGLRFTPPPFF